MGNLKEQTEAKVKAGRQAKPEFMKGVDEVITKAKALQEGRDAIQIGHAAPHFTLPDASGKVVSLAHSLKKGPVVVTFYRGSWCPYCNLQLRAIQSRLNEIHSLGAELIAISPQVPDGSMEAKEIDELGFVVLSDQDAQVAAQYGVAWQVPEFLAEHMRVDRKLDLEAINNGNGTILPIPGTFILNQAGIVTWRYVDVDYRTRAEPGDMIEALKDIRAEESEF